MKVSGRNKIIAKQVQISENIRMLMARDHVSVEQLAQYIGRKPSYVNIRKNFTKYGRTYTTEELTDIAELFHVPLEVLISGKLRTEN